MCKQSGLAPCHAVDGLMGPPLHCHACAGKGGFKESWGQQIQITSHIHILCKQIVLPSCYALDGHMSPPLHCYAWVQVGGYCRKLGVCLIPSDDVRSWLRLQSNTDGIPHPYHMNKMFYCLVSAVDGHMRNIPIHCYGCVQVGVDSRQNLG